VILYNGVSISSRFRDITLLAYWGHKFDLSVSRDVIRDMTVWYPICHFYWWSFGTKPLSL